MGNNFSSHQELNNSFITKNEFEEWKSKHQTDLEIFKQNIITMKDREYTEKVNDLSKQIDTLKNINKSLEDKLNGDNSNNLISNKKDKIDTPQNKETSIQIDEIVDRMITNKIMNIKYLPDFVERQLYKNMLSILIGFLNETIQNGSIQLLGQQITLQMTPL